MRIVDGRKLTLQQASALFKKPAFDQIQPSPHVQAKMDAVFGRPITAAQLVNEIIDAVRAQGDQALVHFSKCIDGVDFSGRCFEVDKAEFDAAEQLVDQAVMESLRLAADNVARYHREQLPKSWLTYREHGSLLGQNCRPLDRVGLYVPGGTAAYPSSVIMNAVPAAIAGVAEIVMAVPPAADGSVNPYVLAAARLAGVHRVFKMGGAQAVAALAFGTQTVPAVDKITGPGNLFVTLAKKAVYGHCDIDMLAGPSEIFIVADRAANARYIAADMLSQAEHDGLASSVVVTDSPALAQQVAGELERQLDGLARRDIAAQALADHGLILIVADIATAMELANAAAPEHLEILTDHPFEQLPYVRHAGAVFLGPYSPEPLGDYLAGPNHVLPTGGTARFYSVLNVETFMKKTSIIAYSKTALQEAAGHVIRLAEAEGLDAHANAIRVRSE